MRVGYDAADGMAPPAGGAIYLGYEDGNYQSYPVLKARFPGALVVPIATNPFGNVGLVGDGPPDNGTWPQWVGWVVRRRAAGFDPTMYTNAASWQAGMAAFRAANVAYPHWWIAQWDGVANVPAGAIGKQYASLSNRYDTSVFADYWPGVDNVITTGAPPVSSPPATAGNVEDEDMMMLSVTPDPTNPQGTGTGIFVVFGAAIAHVEDPTSYQGFLNAGVKAATVSVATYNEMVAKSNALAGQLSGSLQVSGALQVGSGAAA